LLDVKLVLAARRKLLRLLLCLLVLFTTSTCAVGEVRISEFLTSNDGLLRDEDGDGLPDDWELANGTLIEVPDANEDPDADRLTNWQEFLTGTRPNDPGSCLKLSVVATPGGVAVEFLAASNRTYRLLVHSAPVTADWNGLTNIPAHQTNRTIVIPVLPATEQGQYHRVVTPARP